MAFYSAFEGRKGLDMIAKLQPRLILLDWKLPHVSGIEILDQLRKLNLKRLPEVIMVTSRGRIGELEEALEKGAVDYVTKPVRLAHLVDKVVSRLKDKSP